MWDCVSYLPSNRLLSDVFRLLGVRRCDVASQSSTAFATIVSSLTSPQTLKLLLFHFIFRRTEEARKGETRRVEEGCVCGKVPRLALVKRCGNKDEGESWRPGILKRERLVECGLWSPVASSKECEGGIRLCITI